LTNQFYPYIGLRMRAYEALAMSLARLGDMDMAVRAVVWALADPTASQSNDQAFFLRQNMVQLWQYRHNMSTDDRAKTTKESLKAQRDQGKKAGQLSGLFLITCRKCRKLYSETSNEISRCQRCRAAYCSRKCQKSDWQDRRDPCMPVVKTSKDTLPCDFEKYTQCPDETRAMLLANNNHNDGREVINNNEFSMPLAVWTGVVEHKSQTANQHVEHPETPASLMALIFLKEIMAADNNK
jgi:MYND finger